MGPWPWLAGSAGAWKASPVIRREGGSGQRVGENRDPGAGDAGVGKGQTPGLDALLEQAPTRTRHGRHDVEDQVVHETPPEERLDQADAAVCTDVTAGRSFQGPYLTRHVPTQQPRILPF